jgi:micrococcal nuclease
VTGRVVSALVFVLASVTPISVPHAFDALITGCHDGDTCTVLAPGSGSGPAQLRIRLDGIDAPELDQPFGIQARALILRLVLVHRVDVRPAGRRDDRLVADLVLLDGPDAGADVAAALVDAGAAWVEPRYSTDPMARARQAVA